MLWLIAAPGGEQVSWCSPLLPRAAVTIAWGRQSSCSSLWARKVCSCCIFIDALPWCVQSLVFLGKAESKEGSSSFSWRKDQGKAFQHHLPGACGWHLGRGSSLMPSCRDHSAGWYWLLHSRVHLPQLKSKRCEKWWGCPDFKHCFNLFYCSPIGFLQVSLIFSLNPSPLFPS